MTGHHSNKSRQSQLSQPTSPMHDEKFDDAVTDPPSQSRSIHESPSGPNLINISTILGFVFTQFCGLSDKGTIVEHDGVQNNLTGIDNLDITKFGGSATTIDLYGDNDEDMNQPFEVMSDEEEDENDLLFPMDDEPDEDMMIDQQQALQRKIRMATEKGEYDDDMGYQDEPSMVSLTQTPTNSTLPYQYLDGSFRSITTQTKGSNQLQRIPEIKLDQRVSQDTLQTMETGSRSFNDHEVDTIYEDSETDDINKGFNGFESPSANDNKPSAFTRYCYN